MPPFESLGCFRFQEKNGSEAAAGGENSVNNSGKQPGSGRSQWELVGASWARCGVGGESHGEERRNEVLKREVVVGCSPLFG